MNLLWHIIWKDVRALRWYLTALFTLALLLGLRLLRFPSPLAPNYAQGDEPWIQFAGLVLQFVYLLLFTLLLRADAPARSTAEWHTRPLGWQRLLTAKLLFAALCATSLHLILELVCLLGAGYPASLFAPALLQRTLLRLLFPLLPLFTIAALAGSFARSVLTLLAVFLCTVFFSITMHSTGQGYGYSAIVPWPASLAMVLTGAAVSLWLLVHLFRYRVTSLTMLRAIPAGLLLLVMPALPWPGRSNWSSPLPNLAWSGHPADPPAHRVQDLEPHGLRLEFDSSRPTPPPAPPGTLQLPLHLAGLEPGFEFETASPAEVTLASNTGSVQGGSARVWRWHLTATGAGRAKQLWLTVATRPELEPLLPEKNLRLEVEAIVTVSKPGPSVELRPHDPPASLEGVGYCLMRGFDNGASVLCRTPYRLRYALAAEPLGDGFKNRAVPQYKGLMEYEGQLPSLGSFSPLESLRFRWTDQAYRQDEDGAGVLVRRLDDFRNARLHLQTPPLRLADFLCADSPNKEAAQ